MSRTARCLGIVLFQLGGPDTLDAIQPFLLTSSAILILLTSHLPASDAGPLAKLISATRAKKVRHHYSVIGGGSPIRKFTEIQARALEDRLSHRRQCSMLRGHALLASIYYEAIEQVRAANCDEIVLLPLYPQYSSTTTGSSLNEWHRHFCDDIPLQRVESFYRDDALP